MNAITGTAFIIRADARRLPLPDASVDLIVTSPPYYALRSYTDGGAHYHGQIGSEPTPAEYIDNLIVCTREWMRVLKPSGSIWLNLGDKYANMSGGPSGVSSEIGQQGRSAAAVGRMDLRRRGFVPMKSLMLLPERYRIAAVDQLGLIARAVVVWSKPNGLPESVTDRVRRSHEDWVHLTKQPRYFSAVDEIRETYALATAARYANGFNTPKRATGELGLSGRGIFNGEPQTANPLGKLPGSVWEIATQPLKVPKELGVDHFAAFPMEWPRRLILGWSPSGVCTECGQGRRPVQVKGRMAGHGGNYAATPYIDTPQPAGIRNGHGALSLRTVADRAIIGYVCACTPSTSHRGKRGDWRKGREINESQRSGESESVGPLVARRPGGFGTRVALSPGEWEYHLDDWTPAPVRPAVVLDPFGGTGTTALVASALGRIGISVDASADYCRLAVWRTTDEKQIERAARPAKARLQ